MKIKQILSRLGFQIFSVFFILITGLSFVFISNAPQVMADDKFGDWCTGVGDLNQNLSAKCYQSVFSSMDSQYGVDGNTTKKRIQDCGAIRGGNEGECANALIACYNTMLDKSRCQDNKVVADISYQCNGGRINPNQGSNQDECDIIARENGIALVKVEEKYTSAKACETDALKNSDLQRAERCRQAVGRVGGTCAQRAGLQTGENGMGRRVPTTQGSGLGGNLDGDNSDYVGVGSKMSAADYDACLKQEMLKEAQDDAAFCSGIPGSVYINRDTKDPGGPNTLKKGCYGQDSDLTNPEACRLGAQSSGRDLVWQKTNKPGESEAYGCVDKNDQNNDGEDDSQQGGTGAGGSREEFESCGEAETVLIKCNVEGSGAPVIAEVLRIGVYVLTVIIGIGAVGGLAYAAVLYAKAEDNSGNVTEARTLIRNIVIGLFLYGFMIAIVNWLVPGGVIG